MKRLLVTLALASLVLPAAALGKGPSAATIDGPGTGGGMTIPGDEGSGPLSHVAEQSGFYPSVFRQTPDPMLAQRPKGGLGPKYTITYTVPGPNGETWTLKQDVYPYATSGPVTYMAPGQDVFEIGGTRGGWYQAGPALKEWLVSAGLPKTAPTGSSDGFTFPTVAVSLLILMLLLLSVIALAVRRRPRPAAAA